MAQTLTSILLHVIFSTKNRAPDIRTPTRERLWRYIAGILKSSGAKVHTINGGPDHVHILFTLPPTLPLADLMRLAKTNSSRWLRREFPSHRDFAWQPGYAAFSVSYSKFDDVFEYIAHQERHHHTRSFEEELVSLLKKNELEFEEKYLWS